MNVSLGDLARFIGAALHGDPDCPVSKVATLDAAQKGDVAFLYDRRYRQFLQITGASAVILHRTDLDSCPVAALVTDDPHLAYARAATFLNPPSSLEPGIHPTACIMGDASIDRGAYVGPHAVIETAAKLGSGTFIGPNCVIGPKVAIGDYTKLVANVTVLHGTTVGRRCMIHPGVVIGADGFGLARDHGAWVKIPQLGGVHIGDDVEIGANTTIDRGALKDTVIEDGVKLDNQIQVGHNVRIGAHTAVAGCVGISGSTRIGKRCLIGGGAGIAGHLEIADDVTIKAAASVTKSILRKGIYSSVWPAREDREWRKRVARFHRMHQNGSRSDGRPT